MALVGQVTAQTAQVPPPSPHAPVVVPGWHVVPPQQPPLQGDDAVQLVEHAPPLHAFPERQSDSVLQPQAPPTHAEPLSPEQSAQATPPEPQAPEALPGWHLVPSQQPSLHVRPPVQLGLHVPALQALPERQSASVLQPQTPPTHA